jgi:hypothetical protein
MPVININEDQLLTPAQAAGLRPLGRRGRPTHPSTIYRWMKDGVRGVRLESVRLGGCTYTSREAIQQFAERLTEPNTSVTSRGESIPSTRRRRKYEQASRLLDRLGI